MKKISIIIPVKNGEKYLKEALKSINKQNMPVEIILVNDGSNDSTKEIAQAHNCIIINKEVSQGPVKAKNDALKIANGEYILFLDHDDMMRENALKTMYDILENDKTISAVEAKVKDFYSPDLSEAEKQTTSIKKEPYYGLFTGAILIRKSAFDKIGFFDESVTAGEIIEWQNKMDLNNLIIQKIDLVSTSRRIHSSNFGRTNKKQEFTNYALLLRRKIRK